MSQGDGYFDSLRQGDGYFDSLDSGNAFFLFVSHHCSFSQFSLADALVCLFLGVKFPWRRPLPDYMDFTPEFEHLSLEQAEQFLEEGYQKGLMHNLATMKTPYSLAVCSCESHLHLHAPARGVGDQQDIQKSEYLISIDPDLSTGCRLCVDRCQPLLSPGIQKAGPDAQRQAGSGRCPENALECALCIRFCPREIYFVYPEQRKPGE